MGIFYGGIGSLAGTFNKLKKGNIVYDRIVDVGLASFCKFVSILLTNPFYMLKTRAESMKFTESHTIFQDMKKTYKTSGLMGFYNGFWATIIRDVPYQGIQFGIYKLLGEFSSSFEKVDTTSESGLGKIGTAHLQEKSVKDSTQIFILGGISSVIACILTQPFDSARVNSSHQIYQQNTDISSPINKILLEIYSKDGVSGLYRGYLPRVLKKAFTGALTWALFEKLTNKSIH